MNDEFFWHPQRLSPRAPSDWLFVCPQRIIAAAESHVSGICAGAREDQTKRVKRRTAHAGAIINARSALAAEVVRAKIGCVPAELLEYPVRQRVVEPN